MVDERGLHGLICRKSVRHPQHNQLNTFIKQSLASADIPSVLEPQGLSRSDGMHPDGMTIVPVCCHRLHTAQGLSLSHTSGNIFVCGLGYSIPCRIDVV